MVILYQSNEDGNETIVNVPNIEGAEKMVRQKPEKYSFESKNQNDSIVIKDIVNNDKKIIDESKKEELLKQGYSEDYINKILSE